MVVVDFIAQYGGWSWLVFGLVLLALELVVPGGVLVWMGVAAIVTGLNALVIGIGWPWQWATFGILSLISVSGWLLWTKRRSGGVALGDAPLLNQRTARFVGRKVVLVDPITDGFGRVKIADTVWRVSGPDLPEGTVVRVTGAEGAVLTVEPVQ